jgi:hypothetical protein
MDGAFFACPDAWPTHKKIAQAANHNRFILLIRFIRNLLT